MPTMAVVKISRFMAVRIPVVNALLSYEGLEVRARRPVLLSQ